MMARPKSQGETKTHQQHLLMAPSEVEAIDTWRFANRIGSRGEAIRRLVQSALFFDDRADAMHSIADQIMAKLQPMTDMTDSLEREIAADEIIGLAMELASDVNMLAQSRATLSDGERTILLEQAALAREKFREARAKRVAGVERATADKDAALSRLKK
jgi:hypothetical protein